MTPSNKWLPRTSDSRGRGTPKTPKTSVPCREMNYCALQVTQLYYASVYVLVRRDGEGVKMVAGLMRIVKQAPHFFLAKTRRMHFQRWRSVSHIRRTRDSIQPPANDTITGFTCAQQQQQKATEKKNKRNERGECTHNDHTREKRVNDLICCLKKKKN